MIKHLKYVGIMSVALLAISTGQQAEAYPSGTINSSQPIILVASPGISSPIAANPVAPAPPKEISWEDAAKNTIVTVTKKQLAVAKKEQAVALKKVTIGLASSALNNLVGSNIMGSNGKISGSTVTGAITNSSLVKGLSGSIGSSLGLSSLTGGKTSSGLTLASSSLTKAGVGTVFAGLTTGKLNTQGLQTTLGNIGKTAVNGVVKQGTTAIKGAVGGVVTQGTGVIKGAVGGVVAQGTGAIKGAAGGAISTVGGSVSSAATGAVASGVTNISSSMPALQNSFSTASLSPSGGTIGGDISNCFGGSSNSSPWKIGEK